MEQEQRGLSLDRIYLKDLSFESPRPVHPAFRSTPAAISIESRATIQHQIFSQSAEVALRLGISGKIGSEHVFYLEVVQAGLFRFFSIPQQELAYHLHVRCPDILFPYARELVTHQLTQGGFPHLFLLRPNFEAMYQQLIQDQTALKSDQIH